VIHFTVTDSHKRENVHILKYSTLLKYLKVISKGGGEYMCNKEEYKRGLCHVMKISILIQISEGHYPSSTIVFTPN